METFLLIVIIIPIAIIIPLFFLKRTSSSSGINRKKDSPSKEVNLKGASSPSGIKKAAPSVKVNLIISDTPPPGGILFKPDGTIERIPDSPTARYKWTIQKMTYKIEQEPEDYEWYFERGKAFMGLNQYQEAISDFSKLIEKYPTFNGYYELRGLCYFHIGDKANALADLRHYKELSNQERLNESTIKILDELEKELS